MADVGKTYISQIGEMMNNMKQIQSGIPKQSHVCTNQVGFTLIELLIVVIILSILAAIAIPSYRAFVVKNAESDVQAKMQMLEMELERWRTSALSYRGFFPNNTGCTGGLTRCYDTAVNPVPVVANTVIYSPSGSTSSSYRYQIVLTGADSDSTTPDSQSLVPLATSTSAKAELAIGRSWKMVAIPNPNFSAVADGAKMYLDSNHINCKTYLTTATTTSLQGNHNCNGVQFKEW